MPRVALKKREYQALDFIKWLESEMWDRGIKQEDMGNLLGISQQAFSKRVEKRQFDVKEIMLIFHEFDTPPEKIGQLLKY